MNEKIKYSEQWDISAQYFYNKGYYSWMADKLTGYKNVLEVGCGTGYSTLALVEKGYRVIAVEKNPECTLMMRYWMGRSPIMLFILRRYTSK